ncbi:LysE family translocator [Amphritea pacifica]|uniref:LysE family translocator n=1 Tax=Amphritea pacifica TaxID=2811233 RepID=UPI001963824E|nr:LysE family translocator [Amphritea pacifica]MBN1006462.1 LysE family translocator [Amphritea pacifica]
MDIMTLLLFIPACFALNMSPGPNNLMAMNNATRYGFHSALFAGAGRLIAFAGMIFLAAAGLAVILHTSAAIFTVIKVTGACYLFWLAFKLWTADTHSEETAQTQENKKQFELMQQEFFLAAGNPKAILIFTAFLPQFVTTEAPAGLQFFTLGFTFLLLEWLAIAIYALFGLYLRQWFAEPLKRQLFNRSCGTLLASAGIGLLFTRRN